MNMELAPAERASFTHSNGVYFNELPYTAVERYSTQYRYRLTNHRPPVRIIDFAYGSYTSIIDL